MPAEVADDPTFLRRVTLDLAGRVPTRQEWSEFAADAAPDKRERFIQKLMDGPEFPLYLGLLLDEIIQGPQAGNQGFRDYLRRSIAERRRWNELFQNLLIGPWDTDESKPASRFLTDRVKDLDVLTADATRVFFGIDITCAKCHDHPLVLDWTQDHYYGMASFFNRTVPGDKKTGGIGEKADGEIKFLAKEGGEKVARMMFLSGRVVDEPSVEDRKQNAAYSRRRQLVEAALENRSYFSRAIVNRLWQEFFGKGLVHPADQMHSSNLPSVPGLLEWLGDDFADHGYDLHRLVGSLVCTQAYQRSSRWERTERVPDEDLLAVMRLRPLTRPQLAFSFVLATAAEGTIAALELERRENYLAIEKRAQELQGALDPRTTDFQSSAGEALFLSNHPSLQKLLEPAEGNLIARLGARENARDVVREACAALFSREPQATELDLLAGWFEQQPGPRDAVCRQLVWAMLTSAEFRFNH